VLSALQRIQLQRSGLNREILLHVARHSPLAALVYCDCIAKPGRFDAAAVRHVIAQGDAIELRSWRRVWTVLAARSMAAMLTAPDSAAAPRQVHQWAVRDTTDEGTKEALLRSDLGHLAGAEFSEPERRSEHIQRLRFLAEVFGAHHTTAVTKAWMWIFHVRSWFARNGMRIRAWFEEAVNENPAPDQPGHLYLPELVLFMFQSNPNGAVPVACHAWMEEWLHFPAVMLTQGIPQQPPDTQEIPGAVDMCRALFDLENHLAHAGPAMSALLEQHLDRASSLPLSDHSAFRSMNNTAEPGPSVRDMLNYGRSELLKYVRRTAVSESVTYQVQNEENPT
jgi:hypothetical protein